MQIPNDATVAVADGETFNLFRNDGDEAVLKLVAVPHDHVDDHKGGDTGRAGSSANPDGGQDAEDGFSAGVASLLNKRVLDGKVTSLLVIAPPRALGALRKLYHPKLSSLLFGEIHKDYTGHSLADLQKAILAA